MKKIAVTTDTYTLARIGGEDYARQHSGKIYVGEVDKDGWAVTDSAKFDPTTVSIVSITKAQAEAIRRIHRP